MKDIPEEGSLMPIKPDPFWPEGVAPSHLSPTEQKNAEIVAPFLEVVGPQWHCEKCGRIDRQSLKDSRYCNECYAQEVQNSALAKRVNADWMEQSKEIGLAIFERQPEETDLEWRIWERYRSFYPLKLPTWTQLAAECQTSVASVIKASGKWSFKVRLQAWARFTDDDNQEKRIVAIREMNEKQLSMAQRITDKLSQAIDNIQPEILRPGEIVNLMKVATELERRIVTATPEKVDSTAADSRTKQVAVTKVEDLSDVIGVLKEAGVLDGKVIGVEQTTRLIAKEDESQ